MFALAACFCAPVSAAEPGFRFEAIPSLENMASLVKAKFPLGTPRSELRRAFVEQGHATLKVKPGDQKVEKYIYDINLCRYYVWRWNISADYDSGGKLRQLYLNGDIVFAGGNPKKVISKVAEKGKKASIYRIQRPRPQADKGENSLGFIVFDRDSDLQTTDDQVLIGAGPSRPDPANMGKMVTYTEVEPWRSIFDFDEAERVVPYHGDCQAADKLVKASLEKTTGAIPGAR